MQSYFSHPDYLVVQCWVQFTVRNTVIYHPDSVTLRGPQVHCFSEFFPGVGYTHEGVLCHHGMAIVRIIDDA